MNPKPVRKLINLNGHAPGLAGRYQWEKEVLIDYIASRFLIIWEDVEEDAEAAGICSKSDYLEMLQISAALRRLALFREKRSQFSFEAGAMQQCACAERR